MMLSSSGCARRRRCRDVDSMPTGRAFAIGVCAGARAGAGRVALGRHDRRRDGACGSIAPRRPSSRSFSRCRRMAAAFAHDLFEARHELASARGVEIAIGFVMAFVSSALVVKPFSELRPAIGLSGVRVVSHRRSAWRCSPRLPLVRLAVADVALASPAVPHGLLRDRAALHQRRGARVDLRRRRRPDDAVLRSAARPADSRARHFVDGGGDHAGGRARHERARTAAAARAAKSSCCACRCSRRSIRR